jgi:hypothetical protein
VPVYNRYESWPEDHNVLTDLSSRHIARLKLPLDGFPPALNLARSSTIKLGDDSSVVESARPRRYDSEEGEFFTSGKLLPEHVMKPSMGRKAMNMQNPTNYNTSSRQAQWQMQDALEKAGNHNVPVRRRDVTRPGNASVMSSEVFNDPNAQRGTFAAIDADKRREFITPHFKPEYRHIPHGESYMERQVFTDRRPSFRQPPARKHLQMEQAFPEGPTGMYERRNDSHIAPSQRVVATGRPESIELGHNQTFDYEEGRRLPNHSQRGEPNQPVAGTLLSRESLHFY